MPPTPIIYGSHDANTLAQINLCAQTGNTAHAILCADGHYGYNHPIGGVTASPDEISISGVGYDIGCGNLAVMTDLHTSEVKHRMSTIMDDVVKNISFGVGRVNNTKVDHPLLSHWLFDSTFAHLKDKAAAQLGTVGSGNHYVDIFEDDEQRIWVGVHFGSRGLGHGIATHYYNAVGAKNNMDAPPAILKANSDLGREYIFAMNLAGSYASAGREWVVNEVVENILGGTVLESVHNYHNFAWLEEHDGKFLWVVRKGSTPAFPGQKCFVGGSMGDNAVILAGIDSEQSRQSLFSTVHGAGRTMGRNAAKKAISAEAMFTWLQGMGMHLRGGDLDEAPQAYRRLEEVLNYHAGTVKVLHNLKPLGVAMAGKNITDPYKD